jgi:5-methylcytosine-specific restriction endonuclease McrA
MIPEWYSGENRRRVDRVLRKMGFNPHSSLWEADHIVPVAEGGGACGLENYRTLCVPCHKEITAEWHRNKKNT